MEHAHHWIVDCKNHGTCKVCGDETQFTPTEGGVVNTRGYYAEPSSYHSLGSGSRTTYSSDRRLADEV